MHPKPHLQGRLNLLDSLCLLVDCRCMVEILDSTAKRTCDWPQPRHKEEYLLCTALRVNCTQRTTCSFKRHSSPLPGLIAYKRMSNFRKAPRSGTCKTQRPARSHTSPFVGWCIAGYPCRGFPPEFNSAEVNKHGMTKKKSHGTSRGRVLGL